MLKSIRRPFALILTLVMCLSLLPVSAFAAEPEEEGCAHELDYVAPAAADCVTDGCGEYYVSPSAGNTLPTPRD